eukprot:m.285816 g.285816  ORF g.285816 m.285816 type:complete len:386 (-) comp16343_c0_seq12:1048-2205(-)
MFLFIGSAKLLPKIQQDLSLLTLLPKRHMSLLTQLHGMWITGTHLGLRRNLGKSIVCIFIVICLLISRPINWNCSFESRKNHPPTVATEAMITPKAAEVITGIFKDRWRTLMSVDDVIADVIQTCKDIGVDDNTYYFYSSDHGFQLGEFNILMDKRHVYEWDIKIHLLARGPGIKPGSTFSEPATQVDMAPTFLGLAGVSQPEQMDGKSLVPIIVQDPSKAPETTLEHLKTLGDADQYRANWRTSVFIEYYFNAPNVKCVNDRCANGTYPKADSECVKLDVTPNQECWCPGPVGGEHCYPTETTSNNFIAIRTMEGDKLSNMLYAEYQNGSQARMDIDFTDIAYYEYFNLTADPWEMNNLHGSVDTSEIKQRLHMYYNCAGSECP